MTFGPTPRRILPPISGTFPLFGIDYEIYRLFAAVVVACCAGRLLSCSCIAPSSAPGCARCATTATPPSRWAFRRNASTCSPLPSDLRSPASAGLSRRRSRRSIFAAASIILPFCFMAVIIGGLGNLPGTAAAAILLSLLEGIIQSVADPTVARISSLVLMSAVLLLRPQGPVQRIRPVTNRIAIERVRVGRVRGLHARGAVADAGAGQQLLGQRDRGNPDLVAVRRQRQSAVRLCRAACRSGRRSIFGFGMYGVGIGIDQLQLSFWPAFGLGIVAAMAMALVSGIFAVRLTWHYFAIITVVFSLIFYFLAVTMKPLTGGDDGINFTLPPTFSWGRTQWSFTDATFQYFFILATVSVCFYLMHRVIRSPLGKAFLAIRDNDVRASLIGLNVYLLRLMAFVMAGFLAGVAGALFAFFGRYASASYMFYHVSGEAVVWAIVGGAGTLFGPIIGTSLFIIIRELVSTHWEHHSLIVGIMAIVVVILAPKGLVGLWRDGLDRLTATDTAEPAAAKLPTDPKLRTEP